MAANTNHAPHSVRCIAPEMLQPTQHVQITGLVVPFKLRGTSSPGVPQVTARIGQRSRSPQIGWYRPFIANKLLTSDFETNRNKQKIRLVTYTKFVVTATGRPLLSWATAQRDHDRPYKNK
jgi:hypothetical protein